MLRAGSDQEAPPYDWLARLVEVRSVRRGAMDGTGARSRSRKLAWRPATLLVGSAIATLFASASVAIAVSTVTPSTQSVLIHRIPIASGASNGVARPALNSVPPARTTTVAGAEYSLGFHLLLLPSDSSTTLQRTVLQPPI